MPPELCPVCGAEVPPNARACPECGADDQTGWSEKAHSQRLGLPDDEFDHDAFVKDEFGPKPSVRPHGISWIWWLTAILLLLALLAWFIHL